MKTVPENLLCDLAGHEITFHLDWAFKIKTHTAAFNIDRTQRLDDRPWIWKLAKNK